jgi:hypothetical protein
MVLKVVPCYGRKTIKESESIAVQIKCTKLCTAMLQPLRRTIVQQNLERRILQFLSTDLTKQYYR